jgi:hypothetical protein
VLLKALAEVETISRDEDERIVQVIDAAGYVCVPRMPTTKMIEAARQHGPKLWQRTPVAFGSAWSMRPRALVFQKRK